MILTITLGGRTKYAEDTPIGETSESRIEKVDNSVGLRGDFTIIAPDMVPHNTKTDFAKERFSNELSKGDEGSRVNDLNSVWIALSWFLV